MTWNKSPADGGGGGSTVAVAVDGDDDTGMARLRELGYKQELKRDLSVLSNFAFSFSIISVLTGITTLYNTGLNFGGPATMTFGWFVAGGFTMTVGLSMAEICSSFPTSGGLYYWSARLSGKRWAPFASWITGWKARRGRGGSRQFAGSPRVARFIHERLAGGDSTHTIFNSLRIPRHRIVAYAFLSSVPLI